MLNFKGRDATARNGSVAKFQNLLHANVFIVYIQTIGSRSEVEIKCLRWVNCPDMTQTSVHRYCSVIPVLYDAFARQITCQAKCLPLLIRVLCAP